MTRAAALAQLQAEARYAAERVALYRRRVLMGRGDARPLAEREREAAGAAERVRRAQDRHD